jgi:hypothetical protein
MKSYKKAILLIVVVTSLILSACSVVQIPGTSASTASTAQSSLSTSLAAGTLLLEGTSQSITQEQASQLLPLWKGIRSLSSGGSAVEIKALYAQIQEILTAEQVQAIEQASQSDLAALATKYGVQASSSSQAAPAASGNSNSAWANSNSAPVDASMAASGTGTDMTGGTNMDVSMMTGAQSSGQTTSAQAPSTTHSQSNGTNLTYLNAVIELLQQRVSSKDA